jgi:hypothetical protein
LTQQARGRNATSSPQQQPPSGTCWLADLCFGGLCVACFGVWK